MSSDAESADGVEPVRPDEAVRVAKARLRAQLRRRRAELTPAELERRAQLLSAVLLETVPASAVVAGYLPMPGEPDLRPFLHAHLHRGGEVLVPVIPEDGSRLLQWTPWTPQTALRRHSRIPVEEPVGPRLSTASLLEGAGLRLLVPALAVDDEGRRLGQGGGYYDTTFSGISLTGTSIAVVHAEEVLPRGTLPVEDHDLRVSRIASEAGVVDI